MALKEFLLIFPESETYSWEYFYHPRVIADLSKICNFEIVLKKIECSNPNFGGLYNEGRKTQKKRKLQKTREFCD